MSATTVTLARTRAELADALQSLRAAGRSIAVVPTMGALHEGHRSLMRAAHEYAEAVVVTIFVNPLQFGAGEDLDRYPRPFEADLAACAEERVDVVFAPERSEVYPDEPLITVSAGELGTRLCGASRPGHFDGVLTVVAKLLHLVGPDVAVLGEKDAQQLVLIRRMVRDLDFPVRVVGGPTVREADGLALSSRNVYLPAEGRRTALALSRALQAGVAAAPGGPSAVVDAALEVLEAEPGLRLDYLELVDPATLDPVTRWNGEALLAVAGWVGNTRLIDNVVLTAMARTHKEP